MVGGVEAAGAAPPVVVGRRRGDRGRRNCDVRRREEHPALREEPAVDVVHPHPAAAEVPRDVAGVAGQGHLDDVVAEYPLAQGPRKPRCTPCADLPGRVPRARIIAIVAIVVTRVFDNNNDQPHF